VPPVTVSRRLLGAARVALVLLVVQIMLGGWTSTNYAALACSEFPACQGSFWPPADYAGAFQIVRELGMTADGEILSFAALTAIHWSHRIGAALIALALSVLAWALFRRRATRAAGLALFAALALQMALGVANVLFSVPLPLAVAHNAGAALLIGVMVTINYRMRALPRLAAMGRSEHERAEHENSYA